MGHPTYAFIEGIWSEGCTPKILVDATHKDVVVPEFVRKRYGDALPLNLAASMPLNIVADDSSISADLAFDGVVMRCVIPWNRIYVVINCDKGNGVLIKANKPSGQSEFVQLDEPMDVRRTAWSPRVIKGGKSN
jgi:stringent starvation protein B